MATFLANENTPGAAVHAARELGIDRVWVVETARGASDLEVLAMAARQGRVLITFDKDFGELVFRLGRSASHGVILLRPRMRSPEAVATFVRAVLSQRVEWAGHFSVAREGSLRVLPLP